MNKKIICIVVLSGLLTACAVGRKQDYLQAQPSLSYASQSALAVGVQDHRPYVLNGDKEPDFVGLQRGGYGNPFDVRTESEAPLADEMGKVLVKSLTDKGASVMPVKLAPKLSRSEVLRTLQSFKTEKALLLTLYDWESDTAARTEIKYDAEMEALDKNGVVLAKKRIKGLDQLGGSFFAWDPQAHAQESVIKAFQQKLEELYSGDVAAALNK
jgi:hypothetical protein